MVSGFLLILGTKLFWLLVCVLSLACGTIRYIAAMRRISYNNRSSDHFRRRYYQPIFGANDNITRSFCSHPTNCHRSYNHSNIYPRRAPQSWNGDFDSDEALARYLQWQEMNDGIGNMSISDEVIARQVQEMEDGVENISNIYDTHGIAAENEGIRRGVGTFTVIRRGGTSIMPPAATNQDDVDPDNMNYEEITQLGESIGNVSTGLSDEQISRLPSHKIRKKSNKRNGNSENEDNECAICKMEYKRGDVLITLPCAHKYHEDCIKRWLRENNSCCICKVKVA